VALRVARARTRDEVDPEELHGHEDVGQAEQAREHDGDDLADVGRDQVADEGLRIDWRGFMIGRD
jgi:hypothetical protein